MDTFWDKVKTLLYCTAYNTNCFLLPFANVCFMSGLIITGTVPATAKQLTAGIKFIKCWMGDGLMLH